MHSPIPTSACSAWLKWNAAIAISFSIRHSYWNSASNENERLREARSSENQRDSQWLMVRWDMREIGEGVPCGMRSNVFSLLSHSSKWYRRVQSTFLEQFAIVFKLRIKMYRSPKSVQFIFEIWYNILNIAYNYNLQQMCMWKPNKR